MSLYPTLGRFPRRALSLVASIAMVTAVIPAVSLLTAQAASATDPVQVQTTLEGCRRPAPVARCTYSTQANQSDFTTGDLGKNWAELDFVPYRVTLTNNGADQTFSLRLSSDHLLNGVLGYDLIKQGWDSTYNTATAPMFSAGCQSATVDEQNVESPTGVVGGVDKVLTDKVTIHMAAGATCLISYEVRLGLGSHLYSGSSLQSQVLNADYSSIGQRTVSIPVKEVAPQVATTTASASTNTNYTWAVSKTGSGGITVNSCLPAPTEPNVTFHVSYTRTAHAEAGLTVTGTITLTNPSARALTTATITDTVHDSGDGHNYAATVADQTITVPGATTDGPGTASSTFTVDIPLPVGTLTNSAVVTYEDPDQPGVLLPGLVTASTPVTISVTHTTTNATAGLTDDESFTGGSGLSFKRTSTPAMASFATSDEFKKSLDGSGSYDIEKVVKATTPHNGTGTLHDAVTISPSDNGAAADASADVGITVTAANPTITLTKHVDVAPTGADGATFGFTITSNDDPTKSWTTSVTIPKGATQATGTAVSVAPSAGGYSITETPAAGYSAADASIAGPVALCGTVSKDIYDTRDLGHVTVVKVLDGPVAGANDTFTFDVECPTIDFSTTLQVTGHGSASTDDVIPTGTPCTITEKTPPTGWTLQGSVPADGGALSEMKDGSDNTVTVTNQRVLGHIRVHKVLSGPVADASTTFHFTWSCADGAFGTLEVTGEGYAQTGDVIPTGVGCTITETDPGADWSSSSLPGDGGAASATDNGAGNTVTITNTRLLGHIQVTKVLAGPVADAATTFHFDWTCASEDGTYSGSGELVVDAAAGSGSAQTGDAIPLGVSCTVTETDPGADWVLTSTVPQNGGATAGSNDSDGNTVTFTNTRALGHVRVDKSLEGPVAGAEHTFTFDVLCVSTDGTYNHTFHLSIDPTDETTATTADEIPIGVTCSATETGDYPHWTLVSVEPMSGTATSSANDSSANLVSFVNSRLLGHITVVKTLDGDIAGAETTFTFSVDCPGVDKEQLPDLVIDAADGNTGRASTDDVIPTGVTCSVTETGTYQHWTLVSVTPHGEDTTVGSAIAAVDDSAGSTVTFVNRRLTGVITVDKTRVGDVGGASTVFVFDVVCPDFPAYDQKLTIDTADAATASATSTEIPTDVACTVTEEATAGWQQTQPEVGGAEVVVPGTAEFVNTRLTGPLQLIKSVTPDTGSYTPGDPKNTLTYTLTLSEPAPGQLDHTGVVVTDYIPGYDPADTTSGKTTYVAGSATCSTGCTASYDADQHLITWNVGSYGHDDPPVVLTFKVTIDSPTPAADGAVPAEQIDNVGVVGSTQQPPTPSNQVVTPVVAVLGEKVVKPPTTPTTPTEPSVLPFTGSSIPVQQAALVAMVLIGSGIVLTRVRRRRHGR